MWGEAKEPLYRNAIFMMASSVIGTGLGFFLWVIVYQVYDPSDPGYGLTLPSAVASLGRGIRRHADLGGLPRREPCGRGGRARRCAGGTGRGCRRASDQLVPVD